MERKKKPTNKKLIEAMLRLLEIEKILEKNISEIQTACSCGSGGDHIHKILENEELVAEYALLHLAANYTNLMTRVVYDGRRWSLHEVILYRRRLAGLMADTHRAFDQGGNSAAASRWEEMIRRLDEVLQRANVETDLVEVPR